MALVENIEHETIVVIQAQGSWSCLEEVVQGGSQDAL
jgi:hypothetical protein